MTFRTLLIANRGEVAVRIIRACHALGIRAVAVYSRVDRDAPHVKLADDARCIGDADARSSYLDIDAIIDAAVCAGADAVHPGYGFLSENASFAEACIARGLCFVGPSPAVIALMGSKQRARAAALQAGVSIVPGYHDAAQDDDTLIRAARDIGYPVMVKASAGGGGRGMRRVYHEKDLQAALGMARGEAQAAFGDSTVLLERLVERGRHVEVQILADSHGNVLHLHDRDCSVQRNHQKLIEEAPAPMLSDSLRASMQQQSVALSRRIGYVNAGTVEFIVDLERDTCHFLEMNTRLQVEHPVTEAITDIDIVEWQIRIAAGEALNFDQAGVGCNGYAIEARVAAEDPADGFRPGTGRIERYVEPTGRGIRVDSGTAQGVDIGHHYDSMLVKVIAHADNRDRARRQLIDALGSFHLSGVVTNLPFLQDVLALDEFAQAIHHTGIINTCYPTGWKRAGLDNRDIAEIALASLLESRRLRVGGPWQSLGGWRITSTAGGHGASWYHAVIGDKQTLISITPHADHYQVEVDGEGVLQPRMASFEQGTLDYECENRRYRVRIDCRREDTQLLAWHQNQPGRCVRLGGPENVLTNRRDKPRGGQNQVRAPMPGKLVEVKVACNDAVVSGQVVFVLEAMKLYQEQVAPVDGTIAAVHYAAGDHVEGGALVVEIATESSVH